MVKNEDEDDAWLQLLGSLQCRDNHHYFILYGEGKILDGGLLEELSDQQKRKEDKQANHTQLSDGRTHGAPPVLPTLTDFFAVLRFLRNDQEVFISIQANNIEKI